MRSFARSGAHLWLFFLQHGAAKIGVGGAAAGTLDSVVASDSQPGGEGFSGRGHGKHGAGCGKGKVAQAWISVSVSLARRGEGEGRAGCVGPALGDGGGCTHWAGMGGGGG